MGACECGCTAGCSAHVGLAQDAKRRWATDGFGDDRVPRGRSCSGPAMGHQAAPSPRRRSQDAPARTRPPLLPSSFLPPAWRPPAPAAPSVLQSNKGQSRTGQKQGAWRVREEPFCHCNKGKGKSRTELQCHCAPAHHKAQAGAHASIISTPVRADLQPAVHFSWLASIVYGTQAYS